MPNQAMGARELFDQGIGFAGADRVREANRVALIFRKLSKQTGIFPAYLF